MKAVYKNKFSKEEFLELYHESLFPEYKSKDKVVWSIERQQYRFSNSRVRESITWQIDKKFRGPEEEKRAWGSQRGDRDLEFSRRRKEQTTLHPTFLSKDYITAKYPS